MNHRRPFALRALLLGGFLLLTAHCSLLTAVAQSTSATLSGTVEDQNGAVVPGVEITVLNVETSAKRQATTNESGSFTIPLLPPGHYTITARRQGFAPVEVPNVVMNVGDRKALQIHLKAGNISETVQITGDAPLINESPAVGTVIDRQFVGNLPLSGRSLQSLILLAPGVLLRPAAGSFGTLGSGQFIVNGQRDTANSFILDGVSANVAVSTSTSANRASQGQAGTLPGFSALGTTNTLVSVDALQEYRIQTSTYTAELGRQPGGQIVLVTRSGTNQFHGTLFEYLRNEATDANDWFANAARLKRAPLRQNQFGGTFSGPVVLPRFGEGGKSYWSGRNRTFFFFSYEGLRLLLPTTVNTLVPSMRLRQSAPLGVRDLLNTFPLPTGPETKTSTGTPSGVAPIVAAFSSPSSMDATSIRIDHTVGSKLSLFGRYNEAPSSSLSRFLSFLSGGKFQTRTLTLGANLSISPRLNNEFRFNYSRNRANVSSTMDDFGGAVPVDPSVLVSGYGGPGVKRGTLQVLIFKGVTAQPNLGDTVDSFQRQINAVDNLSWVNGAHQFKFGVDYRRLSPTYGPAAYIQTTVFSTEADLLSGNVATLVTDAKQGARPLFRNFSLYAQDTWRVTPRLTLDLGLRWELNPAPRDQNGLKPVLVVGVGQDGDVSKATLAPRDAPFYKTFWTAFAPRFGIAYQLRQKRGRETMLRGGFGVYYDLGSGQATAAFGNFPFSAQRFCPSFDPADPEPCRSGPITWPIPPSLAQPPPFPAVQLPLTNQTVASLDPDLKLPYTLEWSFAVQQSLGASQTVTVSYVAAAARRLIATESLNNPPSSSIPRPPRQNLNFGTILRTFNGPTSDYDSLQVQFQRRLSRGLQALVNYTWSHAIDEVSNEIEVGRLERGNADFDVRHNFSAGVTYDIHKLDAGPVFTALFRDWSVDSIVYAQSGPPLELFADSLFRPDGTQVSVRPDVVPGVPFWIKDPTVPGGQRLNPAAFQTPPRLGSFASRQGTLGRNVVRQPGMYQVNLALRRQFDLSERWKLQLKAEAFNVLNHPLFSGYQNSLRVSGFGRAQNTLNRSLSAGGLSQLYQLGGPRSMQFSLRLSF